jgi:hypothetical protein
MLSVSQRQKKMAPELPKRPRGTSLNRQRKSPGGLVGAFKVERQQGYSVTAAPRRIFGELAICRQIAACVRRTLASFCLDFLVNRTGLFDLHRTTRIIEN